jgi:uncharacterized integral membrane protein (TIGR00698 family)
MENCKKYLSGIGFVIGLAVLVRLIHSKLPTNLQISISEVLIGVAIGLIINHFSHKSDFRKDFQLGIKFSFDTLLKTAIVLLGLKISLMKVASIGGNVLLLILFTISLALILTYILGKLTKTPPKLATLIGIGTAVCGNTAISATGPAIGASDEEISFAIATNTFFGTVAVFFYPLLGQYLGLDDQFFGTWAGTAVNDTSQVVATGFSFSSSAGEIATTVKLTRNALMGFVIIAATLFYGDHTQEKQEKKISILKKIKLPVFIVLFIIAAVLNSLGLFTWVQQITGIPIIQYGNWITKLFILMALIAVGLNTRFSSFKKVGFGPLGIGFASASLVSLSSFLILKLIL